MSNSNDVSRFTVDTEIFIIASKPYVEKACYDMFFYTYEEALQEQQRLNSSDLYKQTKPFNVYRALVKVEKDEYTGG